MSLHPEVSAESFVGGVTQNGSPWVKSSKGDNGFRDSWPFVPRSDPDKKPELVAPGVNVPVLNTEGTWSSASGTSAPLFTLLVR